MTVSVILPAAGLGTRMGRTAPEKAGTSRKQFMLLEGSPILLHTIRKFAGSSAVKEIVVALRGDDLERARGLLAKETFGKPVKLVEGGDSRQHSVEQVHRNKIRQTIPRERLILAQTPQVFRFDLLKQAFAKAREDGFAGTDESSLVERLDQVEVSVIPGSDRNIKITRQSDMDLAKLFLAE